MRSGACALLAACVLLAACAAVPAERQPPAITATAAGDGNSIEVVFSGRDLTLDVWSNRGIGSATVVLNAGPAPTSLLLRLHLRGLEELRISSDEGSTIVSVSSGQGNAVSQRRVAPDGVEQPLAPGDEGWLPTRLVGVEPGRPAPPGDGYFAVTVPPALLARGEQAFSIQWVDFFR